MQTRRMIKALIEDSRRVLRVSETDGLNERKTNIITVTALYKLRGLSSIGRPLFVRRKDAISRFTRANSAISLDVTVE
jgi:hypothetical protein